MELKYILDDAGWAEVVLESTDQKHKITVSYLHDSLKQLIETTIDLLCGSNEGCIVFMDEPGEHHLVLQKLKTGYCFKLKWYDDWASWDMHPLDKYTLIASGDFVLAEFGRSLCSQIDRIYTEYGSDGYKKKWIEHEFPYNQYMKLKREIST